MPMDYENMGKVQTLVPDDMLFYLSPEVNVGQYQEREAIIEPRSALDITSDTDVEFNVPAHTTDFIDLRKTEVQMRIKILKKDNYGWKPGTANENLPDLLQVGDLQYPSKYQDKNCEMVIPIDAFFQTQWKDVILTLNDTIIGSSNHDFPHRTYMDMFLRTDDHELKELEYDELFTRSFSPHREDQPNPYISKDEGAIKRYRRVRGQNEIELTGRIWTDFFKKPNLLLLNGVKMNLRLTPATDKFRFKVTPPELEDQFEYKIESIQLKVQYMKLNPSAVKSLAQMIDKHVIPYKYVRTELKMIPLHAGVRELKMPELFDRNVPLDLLIGMVDVDALYGNYKKDPFFFKKNHIESAAFYVDNVSIPGKAIQFTAHPRSLHESTINTQDAAYNEYNMETGEFIPFEERPSAGDEWASRALHNLWDVAGTSHNGYERKTYRNGNFLIAINTDPTIPADVPYWPTPKMGNTALELIFSKPIPSEQQVLILARFPALVTIGKNRQVEVF